MNKKILALLFLITLLAFTLRFYKVTEIPPSLNWDEVSIGYNAYSVLQTGKDEWGEVFPVHFKSYGEYKLPVHIYASIPGIAIFGLNELGVRITPVVYGTFTVILLFFLTRELFKNSYISLIAALLLAISPWHIQLTRGSFESSFATMWVLMGIWFLIKGFRDPKWWMASVIPFSLSVYTYNTARVFVPIFLLIVAVIYRNEIFKHKKEFLISGILFVILMIPLTQFVLSGEGNSRYKLVSVTDDPGLVPRINEQRGLSTLPDPLPRLLHNKVTYVGRSVLSNYVAHFSPNFLFVSGAPHKQHHAQGVGEMYLFQAPFFILGLWFLISKKYKFIWLLLAWPLITVFPVSFTNDSIPNALRTLISVPFYQVVTGFGIYNCFIWLQRKSKLFSIIGYLTLGLVVVLSIAIYYKNYLYSYPILYSRDWQYGYKQVVKYIENNYDKYDMIVFTRHYGEPHMFTLFYTKYDPAKFYNNPNLVRFETYDWVRVLKFDKYYFPDLGDKGTTYEDIRQENIGKKILFVGKSGDFPKDAKDLYSVNFLNGDKAFEIVGVP